MASGSHEWSAASNGVRVPWPVARLLESAQYAKSAFERRERQWLAWEVSLRLAVAASPPAELRQLVGADLAMWAAAFNGPERELQHPALHRILERAGSEPRHPSEPISSLELLAAVVMRRLWIFELEPVGADAVEQEALDLRDALLAAWSEHAFWPADWRFVRIELGGTVSGPTVPALELEGSQPRRIELPRDSAPPATRAYEVHLHSDAAWRRLDPWLLIVDAGGGWGADHLPFFFRSLVRGVEYVEFDSGELLRNAALERTVPGVLERVTSTFGPVGASPPASTLLQLGRFGDFTLLQELGKGGMGVVHLARQESLGRLVALKTFRYVPERVPARVRQRFHREIDVMARAAHANIVRILSSGQETGAP
jgi:hypothetical protein